MVHIRPTWTLDKELEKIRVFQTGLSGAFRDHWGGKGRGGGRGEKQGGFLALSTLLLPDPLSFSIFISFYLKKGSYYKVLGSHRLHRLQGIFTYNYHSVVWC